MSVTVRQVKNKRTADGGSTSRAGTVYDVFIRYKTADGYKTYGKRGFLTKSEALDHEAEMRTKLINPSFEPIKAADAKQTVKEYLENWVEIHGKANLRPSTFSGYKCHIKNHIVPYIGNVPLKKVTPAMIDNMLKQLSDKGLSVSTCRYAQRILGVAFEAARKYHYIESNPARDILTKFGKEAKTPDPYTVEQMQHLMALGAGNEWEMLFVLSGLYGLRRNEVLGLRWDNVDLENRHFSVVEQLPFKVPPKTNVITEMAPTKSQGRTLPITEVTLPYFQKQLSLQQKQKELADLSGQPYYDNRLVVAKADGAPLRAERVTNNFAQFLRHNDMPHIRFHDLRHSAATNMHELTGDFYTVGEVLGHTLKGIGMSLGISTNMADVTARYVDVRLDRKQTVLEAYQGVLEVIMPENYIAMFDVPDETESAQIIAAARPILEAGVACIRQEKPFPAHKTSAADKLKSGVMNALFYTVCVKAKAFDTTDACINCGKCERGCPMNNIHLKDGKPVWGNHCTHCMACICGCPTEAIEYGKHSHGKPRYQCVTYNG